MKVQINKIVKKAVHASDLQIGEAGTVVNGKGAFEQFNGHIVLRAFGQLISLTSPNSTWEDPNFAWPQFEVELLPKGTELLLTV